MPLVTVNIANPGTPLASGGTSTVGHMWYSISDGQSPPISNGFAPNEAHHGDPFAPGQVYHDDDSNYLNNDYSTTFEITQEQYDRLKDFGENPSSYGFDTNYNGLKNSCIDFTWKALKEAGLNPSDTEGNLLPPWNSDEVKDLFDDQKNKGVYENHKVDPNSNTWWDNARNWRPKIDPLTLDLDGDGIETIGINAENNVLFDHDGDGAKHGTGWVNSDDAMLVLDRNGNGTIDSGRELFGDSTIKSNGQYAVDGFDALKDIDSNNDGVVNSSDSQFSNLRLWRDLNQDGISQTGELFNLNDYNISSLNVTKTENTQNLANGNQIADTGTFTKSDGSTGYMADVNLVMDRFNREFANTLDTTSVASLPDMQGSGVLRDLREAATQSSTLVNVLTSYTSATTRVGQLALLDSLMDAWADTGGMAESIDDRAEDASFTFSSGLEVPFVVRYQQFGSLQRSYVGGNYSSSGTVGGGAITSDGFFGRDVDNDMLTETFRQKIAEWTQKLHVLESFNGSYFFGIPQSEQTQGATDGITVYSATSTPSTNTGTTIVAAPINISLSQFQIDALQKSYEAVRGSIYQSLLLQTRFKPLLDQINLVINENGIRLDFDELKNTFVQKIQLDPQAGLIDLIDFNFASKDLLVGTGWSGWQMMSDLVELTSSSEIMDAFVFNAANIKDRPLYDNQGTEEDDVSVGNGLADTIFGDIGNDVLVGLAGADTLYGDEGTDILIGGTGNDVLWGYTYPGSVDNDSNDYFYGGKGDDHILGTRGSNTYYFDIGDGKDTIDAVYQWSYSSEQYTPGPAVDKLILGAGITPEDVTFSRLINYGNYSNTDYDLFINFINGGDQIIVKDWFRGEYKRLQSVEFADGTVVTDFTSLVGTSGNDRIKDDTLLVSDNVINGLGGDDSLIAGTGTDRLLGGDGNDYLYGYIASNGHIHGSKMQLTNHIFEGGTGNDHVYGTGGANTYIFNLGDGHDVISTTGDYYNDGGLNENPVDKLVFGEGILPSDVTFSRVSGYYDKDLKINFTNTGDSITLSYWYSSIGQRLQTIEFADGTVWTQSDFNKLIGTSGNDNIRGDTLTIADETISGGEGSDSLYGGTGTDTLIGGAGNDFLYGDVSIYGSSIQTNDVFEGGAGNDSLYGTGGINTYIYNLGDGQDVIEPTGYFSNGNNGQPIDKLVLGAGINPVDVTFSRTNDYYDKDLVINFTNSGDQIRIRYWFSSLNQRLASIEFSDGTVWSQADFNSLVGTSGNDNISGDTLTIADETINGGDGNDIINGGTGVDTLIGAAGGDTVYGGAETDALIGGAGNDYLYAFNSTSASKDELTNDTFDGGTGNDYLYGTGGENTYIFNLGDGVDVVDASGYASGATYTASPAVDKLILGLGISALDVKLSKVSNNLVMNFINPNDQITFTNWYLSNTQRLATIEFADGTIWDQSAFTKLVGTTGNDTITGDTRDIADETINGLAGNDTISGGTGTDVLIGGSGVDYLYAFSSSSTSKDELTNDTLEGGTGNDYLNGTGGANTFIYNLGDGADIVDASGYAYSTSTGPAIDKLVLGLGISAADVTFSRLSNNLVINFTNPGDQITFTNWYSSNTQRLANIEFADGTVWTQSDFNKLVGTSVNDTISGDALTAANELINGLAGNDTISGGSGTDVLMGGSGNDYLYAFSSSSASKDELTNDTLEGGTGNDYLLGTGGANTFIFNLGDGIDVIDTSGYAYSTTSGPAIDKLKLGAGISASDITFSKVSNNLIINFANAGDQITFTNWYYSNAQRLANIEFSDGTINSFLGTIGTSGIDYLIGTTSADTMLGGLGDDVYFVDSTSDLVTENQSSGNDYIYSTVTYTLSNHVENLTLIGSSSVNGTGNSLDNQIKGNDSANTLNGGAGVDTLIGGIGNDVYVVDTSTDTIVEKFNEGADTVQSSVTITLAQNVENLTLTGASAIDGTGNTLDNTINGNAASNTLIGGDGNDTLNGLSGNDIMEGGQGNDIYHIDSIGDVIVEAEGAGIDTINVSIASANGTYDVGNHFENAILLNSLNFNLNGNAFSNYLRGNTYNNILADISGGNDIYQGLAGTDTINDNIGSNLYDGGTGTDTFNAGAGNDLFIGGAGNDLITTGDGYDVISFNKGSGLDNINASTGSDNTISLGGYFAYSDLSLTKSTNDLIIKMGATDQITLKDWYASGTNNKSVVNLQVIAEAMQGFTLGGADQLRNNKVESFNFASLVDAFDADIAINAANATNWQLTDARLTAHLQSGSNTEAIGGDLAYQYGKNSNLTGMGLLNAQNVISNASFGQAAQTLNNPSVWQAELVKLA